jgi:hypothetical protein
LPAASTGELRWKDYCRRQGTACGYGVEEPAKTLCAFTVGALCFHHEWNDRFWRRVFGNFFVTQISLSASKKETR